MGAWVMVQFLVLGLRQQWPQYVEHEPMNGCVFLRAGGRTRGGGGGGGGGGGWGWGGGGGGGGGGKD